MQLVDLKTFLILQWGFIFKKRIVKFNTSYFNKDIKQQISSFYTFYCLFSSCIYFFFKYHTTCLTNLDWIIIIYIYEDMRKKNSLEPQLPVNIPDWPPSTKSLVKAELYKNLTKLHDTQSVLYTEQTSEWGDNTCTTL